MNPAEQSARADAERRGVIVGTPEDVTEDWLITDTAGDEACGFWLLGEGKPTSCGECPICAEPIVDHDSDQRKACHDVASGYRRPA